MYKSFYNLGRKPFEITPDTSFLWLGEHHKEALSTLRYGLLDNKGFLLLMGDSGVGKTSLVKALTASFDSDVEWGVIEDPTLDRIDFYNEIARNFGIDKKFTSKVQFLIQFSHFLHKADDENKKVLLLIDQCHLLSQEMLEEMRLLSNIEKADSKLINIFFVGESGFSEMLGQPKNRAVRQRITLKTEIPPLSAHETEDYIRHRLNVAGAEDKIFSAKACQVVYRYSAGIPLQINKICDAVLKFGAEQGESTVTPSLIESSLSKVDLSNKPKDISIDNENGFGQSVQKKDYAQFKLGDNPNSKITGFNLEADRKNGWLKLGLAALAVVVVGGYFFKSNQTPVVPNETTTQVVEQVKPLQEVAVIPPSPAVAVLGQNDAEINQVKVDELKSAILEKAYEAEVLAEETAAVAASLVAEEVVEDATLVAPDVDTASEAVTLVEEVVVIEQKPEELPVILAQAATEGVGESVSQQAEVEAPSLPVIEEVVEVIAVENTKVLMEPLEPRKITLPLQPNSLKLTRAGRNNLSSFVEKLKNYPRATILIKGFVSSKSNSPENIKLSEARALSIYKMLLKDGIDAEQIEMEGMGNKEPIASNDTRAGRTKNRRVEIVVISDGL
jgi:general secretion pathway protein A